MPAGLSILIIIAVTRISGAFPLLVYQDFTWRFSKCTPAVTLQRLCLHSSNQQDDNIDFSLDEQDVNAAKAPLMGETRSGVTFLGKGSNAIVRLGVVLVAPLHEYHHFYRQSAIYIYDMGEHESGEYLIRGLLLDHPTPFTLGETSPNIDPSNPLARLSVFRGGDQGQDGVVLLHNCSDFFGAHQTSHEVADGIYQGGWDAALSACQRGSAHSDSFKVFFNYCEFTETQLDALLQESDDGDSWMSVQVPSTMILSSEWGRGEAWARLRNIISQMARK